MANCSNCSAPLPPNSICCEYCGSRNDTDLKGVHYYTTHESESQRICPRCGIALRSIDLKLDGRFLIERCDECLGLFFDPAELEALLDATVANVYTIDRGKLDAINSAIPATGFGVSYVKCPVCSKLMNRVNFGAKSGVIVDRCRDHGVWLDGGELRHLFEWMKAGGQLLDREKKEQSIREEAGRERRKRLDQALPRGAGGGLSGFEIEGGSVFTAEPDLIDILSAAVRFFRT